MRWPVCQPFCFCVNARSHEVSDEDLEALAAFGLDAEDAWDIASITAFFGLSNRIASTTGLMPNPEFYLMGRVPRKQAD